MKKELINNDYVLISVYTDTYTIEVIWKRPVISQEYRDVFEQCLAFQKEYHLKNWLSDITKQGVMSPEDSKWMETVAIPTAYKNGLEKIALVVPADIFKKYYASNVKKRVEQIAPKLTTKYFDNTEEAYSWIKTEDTQ